MKKTIRLADPSHSVPLPGQPGRVLSGTECMSVNILDPFWSALWRDRSIIEVPDESPGKTATPAKSTETPATIEDR